jgi:SAM-dependent methyltransferase
VPVSDVGDSVGGPSVDRGRAYGRWFYDRGTGSAPDAQHEVDLFARVADVIATQLAPSTVLDAGCGQGLLVGALRDRDVDASGVDASEAAIGAASEDVRPHLRVGSVTAPIEGRYDLVICVGLVEQVDPSEGSQAIANLCGASDRVLFSSTPDHLDEPAHVNVQAPERWSQLFAAQGLYRDFHHDTSYVSPWAALYTRADRSIADVVLDYDRAWSALRAETVAQRRALLDLQRHLEQLHAATVGSFAAADQEDLRKEVLRLRDTLLSKEAELSSALGRNTQLEAEALRDANAVRRLDEILQSRSWRLMWAAGKPLRELRQLGRRRT